jgi:hypothetical protein
MRSVPLADLMIESTIPGSVGAEKQALRLQVGYERRME